ncbi:MAG: hypothetical protein QM765_10915 [Myxococcales bacterium]
MISPATSPRSQTLAASVRGSRPAPWTKTQTAPSATSKAMVTTGVRIVGLSSDSGIIRAALRGDQ